MYPGAVYTRPMLQVSDVIRLVEAGVSEEVIARFMRGRRLEKALAVDDLMGVGRRADDPTRAYVPDRPRASSARARLALDLAVPSGIPRIFATS